MHKLEFYHKIFYGAFGWHDLDIWIGIWVIKIQITCLRSLKNVKNLNLTNPLKNLNI